MDSAARAVAQTWSAAFSTPDEMAAAQKDASVEYQSLADRAQYAGRLTVVQLGGMHFQAAVDGAHVVRGTVLPERAVILLPNGRVGQGLRVNGWGDFEHTGVLLRGGSELLAVTPMPQRWSALVVPEAHFSGLAHGTEVASGGSFAPLRDVLRRVPQLRRFSTALEDVAWNDPDRLSVGSVAAALRDELAHYFARACGEIREGWHRNLRLGRRVRLVSEAEEYLRARLGHAIYTAEVGAALGVSERTLAEAFSAVYGMSLQRYLLLRRLNQVNRVLMEHGDSAPILVKTAALDFGFWHLGRFAGAYRSVFGETPSETAHAAARRHGGVH
ncbi:helix-turn-helix domain-containing protein [Roseomonas terrae]|uniref:Helix-turn-helix domain-containing protein n=1 Tax=Neoroseomonas terrae TaxID=424799 RepID=A0ABS5EKB4_9PROT|nr:helix-turn-helix domain-containing protein [Neoroseomonas terrae]MBR0651469.1 helix-turn-helix domain-containing protein [Neoroseomonas terrae]